jgi:L-iditol 2-dehydrogenase
MKAVVVHAPQNFAVEEVPMPESEPDGLMLKVNACGLCGSDLRTLRSGHRKITLPWIIGHEICGDVVGLGPKYEGPWRVGDRLAVGPVVYCGLCDFCLHASSLTTVFYHASQRGIANLLCTFDLYRP